VGLLVKSRWSTSGRTPRSEGGQFRDVLTPRLSIATRRHIAAPPSLLVMAYHRSALVRRNARLGNEGAEKLCRSSYARMPLPRPGLTPLARLLVRRRSASCTCATVGVRETKSSGFPRPDAISHANRRVSLVLNYGQERHLAKAAPRVGRAALASPAFDSAARDNDAPVALQ
jgi:hypothetical protein